MSTCDVCTSTTGDGVRLCTADTDTLLSALHAVPGVVADLRTAYTREDNLRGPGRAVGKTTETPLPWNDRAAQHLGDLEQTLVLWAREVAQRARTSTLPAVPAVRDPKDPARLPDAVTVLGLAVRLLAENVEVLRRHERAAAAHAEITAVLRRARSTTDRAPDRRFLGVCSTALEEKDGALCDVDLYASPWRDKATCTGCGAEHDVEYRRRVLLDAVHDQLVTYGEAERALPDLLGRPVKVSTLRNWVAERRLVPEGYRHDGRRVPSKVAYHDAPLLRVGDIVREMVRAASEPRPTKKRRTTTAA